MDVLVQTAQTLPLAEEQIEFAPLTKEELDFIGGGHATVNTI